MFEGYLHFFQILNSPNRNISSFILPSDQGIFGLLTGFNPNFGLVQVEIL